MQFREIQKKPSKFPIVVKFRISAKDFEIVKSRASEAGETISSYVRKKVVGGYILKPIQDVKDINNLRQHFGLLKHLILTIPSSKSDLEPLLSSISSLISEMREKAKL